MSALALTDNGNLFGAMEFTKKALDKNIQPLLGANLSVEIDDKINQIKKYVDITCLIMNKTGWENLSSLVSISYLNYKNLKKKFIKLDDLFNNNKGFIILFNDTNKQLIIKQNSIEYYLVEQLVNTFSDRIYIDLFRENFKKRNYHEANLLAISYKYDIPLVCTNNISFLNKSMYEAHDCLMCINQSTTISDNNRKKNKR